MTFGMDTVGFTRNFARRAVLVLAALVSGMSAAAPAQAAPDTDTVPYWASLRAKQVNAHVGPGEDYRITFRYHREDLPMKVLRKMEGWRLVQDPDGSRGWMLARFLKPERGAIVLAPMAVKAAPVSSRNQPSRSHAISPRTSSSLSRFRAR